ncbi:hypothetical protein STSO111631_23435 [Stackebrandtia soli]
MGRTGRSGLSRDHVVHSGDDWASRSHRSPRLRHRDRGVDRRRASAGHPGRARRTITVDTNPPTGRSEPRLGTMAQPRCVRWVPSRCTCWNRSTASVTEPHQAAKDDLCAVERSSGSEVVESPGLVGLPSCPWLALRSHTPPHQADKGCGAVVGGMPSRQADKGCDVSVGGMPSLQAESPLSPGPGSSCFLAEPKNGSVRCSAWLVKHSAWLGKCRKQA